MEDVHALTIHQIGMIVMAVSITVDGMLEAIIAKLMAMDIATLERPQMKLAVPVEVGISDGNVKKKRSLMLYSFKLFLGFSVDISTA